MQEHHQKDMGPTVTAVVAHRMQEALQRKAAGDPSWWRLREAALTALSTQVSEGLPRAGLDTSAILSSILEHDLRSHDTPPFLRGRALWVAAKVISCHAPEAGTQLQGGSPTASANSSQAQQSEAAGETAAVLMYPAIECLSSRHDMVVRVCACRAVTQLAPLVPAAKMQPLLPGAYGALLELMNTADQDVLSLVLISLHVRTAPAPRGALVFAGNSHCVHVPCQLQLCRKASASESLPS
jgi:hypothetical protein